MIKAFIFDLDGTLYPRTSPLFLSMASLMKHWFQKQLQISDDKVDEWYEWQKTEYPTPLRAIQAFGLSVASFHQEVFGSLNPESCLAKDAGLQEMLSQLSGDKFVVTLSQYEHAVRVLEVLGVRGYFEDILVHGRNWHTNSKLDAYEEIRKFNGLAPAEMCVVGDNPRIDLLEASENGYKCVAISGYNPIPDISTITTLTDLPTVVQNETLNFPDEKTLLVASFFITNKEALAKLRSQWSNRNSEHSRMIGRTKRQTCSIPDREFGGSIVLIDPDNLEAGFLMELNIPLAFGLCFNAMNSSLYVTSGTVISQIKHGLCVRKLGNPLFNDLHTISVSEAGNLLVTSTGVDALLEVDFDDASKVYWDWLATENGFDKTPLGTPRHISRDVNYQEVVASTPEHTTHINTALNDIPNRIIATLFHQGVLVEIDMVTKHCRTLLEGLKSPHNIRRRGDGYILSDSRANRVLLLDSQFCVESEIAGDFNWVQDALGLDNYSSLVGDSNNDRLVRIDKRGKPVASLNWEKGSRKFAGFEAITVEQARGIFLSERSTEQ